MLRRATLAIALVARLSSGAACGNGATKFLISFGDSYSQTGFDINGEKPSATNPLGNPPLPGWTASGGLDWVGYMVSEFNNSLTLSYNFAYGGATVDADLVVPYDPSVKSLIDQVEEFSNSIASKPTYAPWTAENSVFGLWMGVNDVGNSFYLSNVTDILNAVVDKYFEQMQTLYNAGARQFVILTVPPTDETPLFVNADDWTKEHLQAAIGLFNSVVASALSSFQTRNTNAVARLVDTSIAFNEAIADPSKYGAPDSSCYNEDGVSCLWFNDYHPATAIQRLVAAQVAQSWLGFFQG